MSNFLWVFQIVLAVSFVAAGVAKTFIPLDNLKKRMAWIEHTTPPIVRLVGIAEIVGAVGLVLPAFLRILPWLTPVAAICLGIIMLGAVVVHIRLKEINQSLNPLILFILLLFVIIGRFALAPIV